MDEQAKRYLEAAHMQTQNVEKMLDAFQQRKALNLDLTINIPMIVTAMVAIVSFCIGIVMMQNRMDGFEKAMLSDKEQRAVMVAQRDKQIELLQKSLDQTNISLKDYVEKTGTAFTELRVKIGQLETMLQLILPSKARQP